jgi:hypothetical protein
VSAVSGARTPLCYIARGAVSQKKTKGRAMRGPATLVRAISSMVSRIMAAATRSIEQPSHERSDGAALEALRQSYAWRFALELDQLPHDTAAFLAAIDHAAATFQASPRVIAALQILRREGHGQDNEHLTAVFEAMVKDEDPARDVAAVTARVRESS